MLQAPSPADACEALEQAAAEIQEEGASYFSEHTGGRPPD